MNTEKLVKSTVIFDRFLKIAQSFALAGCAVALIFVGYALYREALTWNKLLGVAICLAGLAVIHCG